VPGQQRAGDVWAVGAPICGRQEEAGEPADGGG
jgi:hypothetical protein